MFNIIHLNTCSSTNDKLKALAKAGAESGTVIIADEQVTGKGQYDRIFESPKGGLYMSVLLRAGAVTEETLKITTRVGQVIKKSLDNLYNINCTIKEPNDIYYKGKKICGVLTESYIDEKGFNVIIGIGLDLNTDSKLFSDELRFTAASLKELCNEEKDIMLVAQCLLENIKAIKIV